MPGLQHPLSFAIHDVCAHIFMLLNCDGTRNETEDPILACGMSSVTLRKTVDEGEEQEAPNPSSTTGKVCAKRAAIPTASFRFLDLTTCGLQVPKLWSWFGIEAPRYDENTGEIIGYEDIVTETSKCQSCGIEGGSCAHNLAYFTVHNTWCGEERLARFPYGVHGFTSIETVLQEETQEFGAGFTSFRELSFRLKSNPSFTDPWNIMKGQPTFSSYFYELLPTPAPNTPIQELLDLSCSCIYCDGTTQAAPVGP